MTDSIPDWVTFPDEDWLHITPKEAGLDPAGFEAFLTGLDVKGAGFGGEDHSGDHWGAVLTRGGYLVHGWGDKDYRFQTASTGKAFMWALIGFAFEDGLLDPDEPINKTWTGEGQLSHPHKHLDQGHHRALTWRHLIGPREKAEHYGGFPIGDYPLTSRISYSHNPPLPVCQLGSWDIKWRSRRYKVRGYCFPVLSPPSPTCHGQHSQSGHLGLGRTPHC